jgi:hypothetical protein
VPVHPARADRAIPRNSFIIRRSGQLFSQLVYNQHLQAPLGCVANKGLTVADCHPQPLYNQHLQAPLEPVANTGFITPLDATLTKIASLTPFVATLPKNRGEGVLWLTRRAVAQHFPWPQQPIFQSLGCGMSVSVLTQSRGNRFARITVVSR